MAINYPSFVVPQPTQTTLMDVVDRWDQGFDKGKARKFEEEAPDQFANAAAPLSQFGLSAPPEQLREMFRNPETRPLAIQMVQEATQRRADASDPMKQLQLKKAQYDVAHQGDAPAGPGPTSDMRNFQFAQDNPGFAEFIGGRGAANAPAEVQTYLFYRDQTLKAGQQPVDFMQFKQSLKEKPAGGTPSPTIAKEIFEADEGAQAGQNVITSLDKALEINDTAWDGPLADISSAGAALFGNQDAVQTQELKNNVTANALESLRATFGGNPTEGERKILLDVQGSITQPRAVRKAIFERAKAAAQRRLTFNQERASALRGGEYFDEGYSPVGGGAAPAAGAGDIDAILSGLGI